jgi:dCMP deaminase
VTHFRPSWDDYFMALARLVSTRATCSRARVGAVLVKQKRIISTGYNGAPPYLQDCDEVGHLMEDGHCIRVLHAEENAILQLAAIGGTSAQGATLYTTHSPCYHCAKKIIAVGVIRIVAGEKFSNTLPVSTELESAGIVLEMYKPNRNWLLKLDELFSIPVTVLERKS